MKKYNIIFLFLLFASAAVAQQKALSSQYMSNYFLLNPAVAGQSRDLNFKAGYRNQWVGFEGAPSTFYLSGETQLFKNRNRGRKKAQAFHGAGGYIYKDVTGPTSRTGVLASYAYHVPLNRTIFLSSGIFAGVQQYSFNENKIHLANGSNEQDPVTNVGSSTSFMPDLSVGTYLHSKEFFVGVSLFQVLGNKIFEFENSQDPSRLTRHLFVSGGYNFEIDRSITVVPSILLKYAHPAPLQADVNVKGIYNFNNRRKGQNDLVWAGLSYRTEDAIVGLVGGQFMEQYELNYSYDLTVSRMRHHSSGSHEITIGYRVR